jgi:hypothetical protein
MAGARKIPDSITDSNEYSIFLGTAIITLSVGEQRWSDRSAEIFATPLRGDFLDVCARK